MIEIDNGDESSKVFGDCWTCVCLNGGDFLGQWRNATAAHQMTEEFDGGFAESAFRQVDCEAIFPEAFENRAQVLFVFVDAVGCDAYIVDIHENKV